MNDPWYVKSVRQSGQYMSCMKINGVPLLPPVLSKECRTEMQYYKILAKEVEKRISVLKPYISDNSDTEASEDITDAPELVECKRGYGLPFEQTQAAVDINIETVTTICDKPQKPEELNISNVQVKASENASTLVIDLSLSINEAGTKVVDCISKNPQHSSEVDLPERDYDCQKEVVQKELLTEFVSANQIEGISEDINLSFNVNKELLSDTFPFLPLNQDGPSSLSSKSFTGSLNNIHTESAKVSDEVSKLVRQSSYTVLKPSPQLLAHLEMQSINTGVEVTSISMSESLSNLTSPKKRRSWDLESAKIKWSAMAMDLKHKKFSTNLKINGASKNCYSKSSIKSAPPRSKSLMQGKSKVGSVAAKSPSKSEPIHNAKTMDSIKHSSLVNSDQSPKLSNQNQNKDSPPKPSEKSVSESEDPATRVRELYEKIQKQQLIQMANLVEKQKKEQLLLQKAFEEQNNLLYKQLKNICPKSSVEIKEAWAEKPQDTGDRGPVSLSQLINHKSPEQSIYDSSVSSTLTDTNNYLSHCDNVLKKSRDITSSIKKETRNLPQNAIKNLSHKCESHAPIQNRNTSTSRKLNYETSASSDIEYDAVLTDRTNDTMADLNVTFPSDNSEEYQHNGTNNTANIGNKEFTVIHCIPSPVNTGIQCRSTDSAIRSMEQTIHNSINTISMRTLTKGQPTIQQRAAASKIVAYAKGYLVRRLMRTERVQSTVQTIKDALLCALQLHQDREGIRGADVDLHRRLIQQITAACYSLHDTFVASTAAERCAMIAADRGRRRSLAARQSTPQYTPRNSDIMSQSHSGSFPSRSKRHTQAQSSLMTQSYYETFSGDKCGTLSRTGYMPPPRRRPWR